MYKSSKYSSPSDIRQAYYRIDNIHDNSVDLLVNSCGEDADKDKFQARIGAGRRDWYLMYVISGKLEITIDKTKGVLERGTAVCIAPETPYFYTNITEGTDFVRYRWIHFTGKNVEALLKTCDIAVNEIMKIEIRNAVFNLWDELFFEFRNNSAKVDLSTAVILPYLLMKVGRSRLEIKETSRKLDVSLMYIHTHLSEQISVDELAAKEFLSPSRYREVFRKVTGYSPIEYITLVRLKYAAELLSQGDHTIDQVAAEVGYTDRFYFQRLFKKHLGVSPGKYIKTKKD